MRSRRGREQSQRCRRPRVGTGAATERSAQQTDRVVSATRGDEVVKGGWAPDDLGLVPVPDSTFTVDDEPIVSFESVCVVPCVLE